MAQLKDLLVTGAARFLGNIYGNLKGTADRAIADKNGNDIARTYATNTTVSNAIKEITLTNNDTLNYTTIGNKQKALTFLEATYDEKSNTATHGLMSAADKSKLDGIANGANKYTHPTYTAKSSGLYKVTVDGTGHVSATTVVTKSDITALGLPTYATCTTDANKQDKEISIPNFTLSTGMTIRVKFTNNNNAASPNLVINKGTSTESTKSIYCYYKDSNNKLPAGVSDITTGWKAGAIITLTYDGNGWIRDYWENTVYTGIPSGGSPGNLLLWKSNGTAQWGTINYAGSSSVGGAAISANKLNTTNAGSPSIPVYFKNGIPVECTEIGSTMLQENTTASSATNTIAVPTNIKNNISSGLLFQVYHNGVLLNNPINYTTKSDNSAITLTYNCLKNDIFTFVLISKVVKTLDATQYLLKSDAVQTYLSLTAAQDYAKKKDYLPLSGGTMTGAIAMNNKDITNCKNLSVNTVTVSSTINATGAITSKSTITGSKVYGAVWNDYAEYRTADTIEPGTVVCENGDDTMSISKERMQPGAAIVSDTFGFAIGETDKAKTPIAVSGRVLAKPYEPIEEFKKAIGRPVCAGPNGTVSIMTDEEYATKGYCVIGTVSAVPNYTTWGDGIKVNNRVWIKVG